MKANVGDWVRWMQNGVLVIGIVQYAKERETHYPWEPEYTTERGVAKELARLLLPQGVYTQAYWTVSLQGLMHFLEQRLKPDAQHEIRAYAEAVYALVREDLDRLGVTRESITSGRM